MSDPQAAARAYEAGTSKPLNYLNAKSGLKSWLLTLDHKRIGLLYLGAIAVFFLFGGVLALVMRLELMSAGPTIDPILQSLGLLEEGAAFFGENLYNHVFTLHGAIMVFMFLVPAIPAILGNFILPMQLGAKDMAFPRLNLASWYVFMLGSMVTIYTIFAHGVDTGWTFYTPYSIQSSGSVIAVTLGIFIIGFSSIFTAINFIVTIHKMRAPGLTWTRLPLFVWALYATAIVIVLATPVLGITLLLLALERILGIGIFNPAMGGDPVLFQHFFWFYSHPAVYIMILPGFGIISELVTAFSHKNIYGYKAIALSSLAIAGIGFVIWGHHMFVSGQALIASVVFSFLTFLVALPSGIKTFNWTATLYKGSISFQTPMLYALSFLFLFVIGGLTGIFLGVLSLDVHVHDTYFVVAHFHYIMVGGTVTALFGGLYYWFPKISGKLYNETWGQIGAGLIFLGFNLTFFVQFVLGTKGMPRRYYDYLPRFESMHTISTVGSWVLGLGVLVAIGTLLAAALGNRKASGNPWNALTLEWHTPSPPHPHNFVRTPLVTHGPYQFERAQEILGNNATGSSKITPAAKPNEEKMSH